MKDSPLQAGLTLVATPIGNLGDVSHRALAALREADQVLCEDTRVTRKLLSAFGIKARLTSYHEHNAARVRGAVLARLRTGARLVLVSDAGTPGICDPGYRLVEACQSEGITVTTVPGPSAFLAALTISGLPTDRFYFGGFLPVKKKARRDSLERLAGLQATLIFYESPRRLAASLNDLAAIMPERDAAMVRELTKLHEEVVRAKLAALAEKYRAEPAVKGEVVLLIAPPETVDEGPDDATLEAALVRALQGRSLRDAARIAAAETGAGRTRAYRHALTLSDQSERDGEEDA